MYKARLQELCQQRQWSLPNYSSIKDGPDHNPRFKASVLINGTSFEALDSCKSSKEAQNEAARLAFLHFTSLDPCSLTLNNSQIPVKNDLSGSLSDSSTVTSVGSTELNGKSAGQGAASQQSQELQKKSTSNGASSESAEVNSNSAGQGALSQLSHGLQKRSSNVGDVPVIKYEMQSLLKNQLQNYAQRRNLSLPLYSCVHVGPTHDVRFKANVTFDGQTFESPESFRKLNDAEHAAAGVALMSLSQGGVEEDKSSFYKNLLQEFIRTQGLSLPTYKTDFFGSSHIPTFISVVEIGADIFQGIAAKTKKQAELNAAKVAYYCLKERLCDPFPNLRQNTKPEEHSKERKGINEEDNSSKDSKRIIEFPKCVTGLPISNDQRVAVKLEFPVEEVK